MPADWAIEHWPECEKHVFLSHCAEDREGLVIPVQKELEGRGIIAWIDRHDYPSGRKPFEALHEELLKCRHDVYFITRSLLRQGRGWCNVERAFSEVLQQQLRYGVLEIAHVELPLVFVRRDDQTLARSVWHPLATEKAKFFRPAVDTKKRKWKNRHIRYATSEIEKFVRQEERWAKEIGIRMDQDPGMQRNFGEDDNKRRRILAATPQPLPRMAPTATSNKIMIEPLSMDIHDTSD